MVAAAILDLATRLQYARVINKLPYPLLKKSGGAAPVIEGGAYWMTCLETSQPSIYDLTSATDLSLHWVNRCIAAGSSNTHKDGVSLFLFPKDAAMRKNWADQVKQCALFKAGLFKKNACCITLSVQ